MDQDELLREVVGVLERFEIRYLITGSIASMFFGEPRFTNDIDIVVSMPIEQVDRLVGEFAGDDYYLDGTAAREAVQRLGQFNLIHPRSGLKVDFIVAGPTAFNESRFARGRRVTAGEGFDATFATPEDVILMKLDYFHRGGSDKHLRDIAGILAVSGAEINRAYVDGWARRLGVLDVWRRAQSADGVEDRRPEGGIPPRS